MALRNLRDYLTVGQAARILGVSPSTLRNWDRSGKLKAIIQPISGYRLYRKLQLERFLKELVNQEQWNKKRNDLPRPI